MTDKRMQYSENELVEYVLNDKPRKPRYDQNRIAISIVDKTYEQLEKLGEQLTEKRIIKKKKDALSFEKTIRYLLDLEEDLRKNNMIQTSYKCSKCESPIDVDPKWNLDNLFHRDIDSSEEHKNCNGRIRKSYGLIDKSSGATGTLSGTNDATNANDKIIDNAKDKIIDKKENILTELDYIVEHMTE